MKENKKTKQMIVIGLILLIAIIILGIFFSKLQSNNNLKESKETSSDYKQNVILYLGMNFANVEPKVYSSLNQKEKYSEYFNTTYDILKDGKVQGKTEGKIKEYEGISGETEYMVDFESMDPEETKNCVFIATDYNAIPREYTQTDIIPEKIKSECNATTMQVIDLDCDNKMEYIVGFAELGSTQSGICLYDSEYNLVSNIITVYPERIDELDGVNYVDIDNDGIMEILVDIPVAASYYMVGVYKYQDGIIKGETGNFGGGA